MTGNSVTRWLHFRDGHLTCLISLSGLTLSCAVLTSQALAQEGDQEDRSVTEAEQQLLDEIVVTGTRVRGISGPVGSNVIGVSREDVESAGRVDVTSMLRDVPQVMNLGVTEVTRDTSGGNGNITYGNAINLRGLGPFSTLSLVDGHRAPINSRNFEPSVVPMLALERIEVVPDGASAVYGSDAVAGVVNMVLRRNVDGGQVMARVGTMDDASEHRFGASWGSTWDRGQFFIAAESSERDNLSGDDRDFFGQGQSTTQCDPGNIIIDGTSYAIPEGGVTAEDAATLTPDTRNTCNSLAGLDIRPKQERESVAFTFNQNLTDRLELQAHGFYSERDTTRLTGWNNTTLEVPSTNAFFVGPTGSATSSTVEYEMRDYPIDGKDVPIGSIFHQLAVGLSYDLGNDWQIEGLISDGNASEWSRNRSNIDNADLNAALASSDPDTAFDPYGLHRTRQAVLDDIKDSLFVANTEVGFRGAELSASGPLFDLPGGTVQFAGGYDRQEYDYEVQNALGAAGTPLSCRPCLAAGEDPPLERDVNSAFGELIVPLVGSGNAVDLIQRLEVRAALRYDDYSDMGSTTNPQLGFTWAPADTVSVRGSWGTSFRAPIFPSIYGNSNALFVEQFPDPSQSGTPEITGVFRSGGNPDLDPEEATNWTVGLDWQPAFMEGLDINLTYFDVEYEQQIQTYLGDNNILFREAIFDGTGIILRGNEAEQRAQQEIADGTSVFGVLPSPLPLFVDGRPQNLGVTLMSGVDFQINYTWDHAGSGTYRLGVNGTYVSEYEEAQTPEAPMIDENNTIYNPKRLRTRASLSWFLDIFSARLDLNYTGSYENTVTTPSEDTGSYVTVDMNGAVQLGNPEGRALTDGWTLSLDIRNLFDEEPPVMDVDPYGFDPTVHDPLGRTISASVRKRF